MTMTQRYYFALAAFLSLVFFVLSGVVFHKATTLSSLKQRTHVPGTVTSVSHMNKVHYAYQIGDTIYSNSSFLDEQEVAGLSLGSTVLVHYVTEHPHISTLSKSRDARGLYFLAIMCGILGTGFAGLLVWGLWRVKFPPSVGYGRRLTLAVEVCVILLVIANICLFASRLRMLHQLQQADKIGTPVTARVLGTGWQSNVIKFDYEYGGRRFTAAQIVSGSVLP